MQEVDESAEAFKWIEDRARLHIKGGMSTDEAIEQTVTDWESSLRRAQLIHGRVQELRKEGKPTLRVGLFDLAKSKKRP